MRISDWSSDVCSSDLTLGEGLCAGGFLRLAGHWIRQAAQHLARHHLPEASLFLRPIHQNLLGEGRLSLAPVLGDEIVHLTFPIVGLDTRSEEHTSELQSLMRISYAVFCLKNKKHLTLAKNTYS